jgi:hypothetical protein
MQCDRVNLGWSVPVQKCQQIFETVAARHKSTLHYCLSSGIVLNRSNPRRWRKLRRSLALWPRPHSEKTSISATLAYAVEPGLGLGSPASGQRRLASEI